MSGDSLLFLIFALFSLNSYRLARICSEQCLELCITSTYFVCLPLYNVLLIVFLNSKLLWIKASAKLINVNVSTCSVQSIQTVSVPRIVRSKYTFNAGSRTNLIVIKPEKCTINEQNLFLKLGLLNIRSLTPKAVIVKEMITDHSFDVLCLTETWLKTNDYFGLN